MEKYTIYKWQCKDPMITDIYVGQSKKPGARRKSHINTCLNNSDPNNLLYKAMRNTGGVENWEFIELETLICTPRDADRREMFWIESLNATLNKQRPCVVIDKEKESENFKMKQIEREVLLHELNKDRYKLKKPLKKPRNWRDPSKGIELDIHW